MPGVQPTRRESHCSSELARLDVQAELRCHANHRIMHAWFMIDGSNSQERSREDLTWTPGLQDTCESLIQRL